VDDLERSTGRRGGQVGALAEPLRSEDVDRDPFASVAMCDPIGTDAVLLEVEALEPGGERTTEQRVVRRRATRDTARALDRPSSSAALLEWIDVRTQQPVDRVSALTAATFPTTNEGMTSRGRPVIGSRPSSRSSQSPGSRLNRRPPRTSPTAHRNMGHVRDDRPIGFRAFGRNIDPSGVLQRRWQESDLRHTVQERTPGRPARVDEFAKARGIWVSEDGSCVT